MTMKISFIHDDEQHKRIIVMGGSFNPPTLAHYKLMVAAVEASGAEKGLFVPSKHEYVQKKMQHLKLKREVLSEEMRCRMLLSMCESDQRFGVDDCEYTQESRAKSYETMEVIQKKYPDAELWFIIGADKLSIIPRWHKSEEFLQRFRILVVARDGILPDIVMDESPFLQKYADSLRLLQEPENISEISSTQVRDLLRNGDASAAAFVHPAVWKLLLEDGWLKRDITSFRGRFEFLSNFYEAPLEYDGLQFGSGEAAFQAQKCTNRNEKLSFQTMRPSEAKRAGRKVLLRPDWEQVKLQLMEEIVRAKFTQNTDLAQMLLATEDRLIQEGNTWHDVFWGVDIKSGEGENHLGKILMNLRNELRQISCT